MADGTLGRIEPASPGSEIDTETQDHGGGTVHRERLLLVSAGVVAPVGAVVAGTEGGSENAVQVVETPQAANFVPGKVTIGTSDAVVIAARDARKSLVVKNHGTDTVYISGTTATTNDFPLEPGESYVHEKYTGQVRAISDSAGQDVRYTETY